MPLPSVISPYTRANLPDADTSEKIWKAVVLAVITLAFGLATGLFLAGLFTEFSFLAALSYRLVVIFGLTALIIWLSFLAISGILVRSRLLKFALVLFTALALWLPLFIAGIWSGGFLVLAIVFTFLGIGFGFLKTSLAHNKYLATHPFAEGSHILHTTLLGIALSLSLVFIPLMANQAGDTPPKAFSMITSVLEQSTSYFGLSVSRKQTLDKTIADFLAFIDGNFKAAPQTIKQTLIASQRQMLSNLIFSNEKYLSGRETLEQLLWRVTFQSKGAKWAFPIGVFFVLLALAVPVRWLAAMLTWVLIEILLSLRIVRIGRELVEREVMMLA